MAYIIAIDIETKPGGPRPLPIKRSRAAAVKILKAEAADRWKTPARQKKHYEDEALIESYMNEEPADLEDWKKQALRPMKGEIFCISVCPMEDDEAQMTPITFSQHKLGDEKGVLQAFWGWLRDSFQGRPKFAGWNINEFDAPFITVRAISHNMFDMAQAFAPAKWGKTHDDLMTWWTLNIWRNNSKLADVCEFFGIGGKPTLDDEVCKKCGLEPGTKMSGALVLTLLENGFEDVVCEYCEDDALAVATLYPTIEYVTRRSRK